MTETACKPFGVCLSELLAKHNLTAASVSRMLGHKSRTTLRRILQDQANAESMEKFLREFKSAQLIALTKAEEKELSQALEVSRIGPTDYLAKRALTDLLCPEIVAADRLSIRRHDTQDGCSISPGQFFNELSGSSKVQFLIINSIPAAFFEALACFLRKSDSTNISIEHYFFLDADTARTVQFISSVFPALKFPCYTPYSVPASAPAWLAGSIMACRAQYESGETHEYQLGASEPGAGHLVMAESGLYDFWSGMIAPARSHCLPVKLSAGVSGDSLGNYLRMAEAYLGLEYNRAIYMLKPTLCLSMIEPELLESALRDGMQNTAFRNDPVIDGFHRQLTGIQCRRFDNMYHKKRVTHALLSLENMKKFVRTGRLADHFFGLRPFTIRERREILTFCRNQSRDNPYFNIYFLKPDSDVIRREGSCYEGRGVLVHDSGTDYNLSGEHADALITLEDFTSLFARYFRETLLPLHAHSVSTSISILNSLIDELSGE